jgi:hypothetical protein
MRFGPRVVVQGCPGKRTARSRVVTTGEFPASNENVCPALSEDEKLFAYYHAEEKFF